MVATVRVVALVQNTFLKDGRLMFVSGEKCDKTIKTDLHPVIFTDAPIEMDCTEVE